MGLAPLQLIELTASIAAAIGATLIMFPRRSGWAFLLLSGLLYLFIFFYNKLYATFALQIGFASLSLYGLISWSKKSGQAQPFRPLIHPLPLILRDICFAILGSLFWVGILTYFTDDPHSYLDGTLSICAMLAQYWMSRAFLCSWILWLIVDSCYGAALFCWHLPMSGLLYSYLGILSIAGFFHWHNLLKKAQNT